MSHRPLIPILISFVAGILLAHSGIIPLSWPVLAIMLGISLCLFFIPFQLSSFDTPLLLFCFLLTGALLDINMHGTSELQLFAKNREKVFIEGTVLEPIAAVNGIGRLKVKVYKLFMGNKTVKTNENVRLTIYDHLPEIKPGDKIRFPARLSAFKNFNNPGRYNYEFSMKMKKLACAAYVSDGRHIVPMGPGHLPFPRGLIEKMQRPLRHFIEEKLDPQNAALYRALILGERQTVTRELRECFNQTGLGHILAVSGLHIGLVAWVAFFLFKWVLYRSYSLVLRIDVMKAAAILTCLPVIAYTFLAGFQVSSQRAMIMVLAFLWSLILGRQKEVWSTLALAGLLILALNPHAIFTMSFQLSFSAVIGILWLTPLVMDKIPLKHKTQRDEPVLNRIFYYFVGLATVSVSASLFLLPLMAFFFHRIPLATIPANITVTPVLGLWVLPLGLFSAVALPISPEVAEVILRLGVWGLEAMMGLIRFWADLPWSSIWVVTPNYYEIFLFYVSLLLICFYRRLPQAKLWAVALALLILTDVGYWIYKVRFNDELSVTYIDVGQGNAALVNFPNGKNMLIDGGGFPRDTFDTGKMVIAPYLWHSKIRRVDYVVLSHPQADHLNGLRFIAREFRPREFWHNGDIVDTATFKELMEIIESRGIKTYLPADLVAARDINGVKIEVLHPKPGIQSKPYFYGNAELNNNSLVLRISYQGKSFLFPGDLEHEGEKVLVSNAENSLKSDVLLSPHHGSKSSSSKQFLSAIQPSICVISSREGGSHNFPHKKTLESLHGIGCRIIRIGQKGAVRICVDEGEVYVKTFLD